VSKLYYPVGLDLAGKPVLVVGGGKVAEGKVDQLLECQAEIELVSPEATPRLVELAAERRLRWRRRAYRPADVEGTWIVIAAADDRSVNAEVAADARAVGRLVNAVDDVPNCDYIAMSVLRRGDLQVAISTGGGSPAMARWLREGLETLVPEQYGALLGLLAEVRLELKAAGPVPSYPAWHRAIEAALPALAAGDLSAAAATLRQQLNAPAKSLLPLGEGQDEGVPEGEGTRPDAAAGTVYLVGAGPGDPDLLTLRAHRLLTTADAVVYDRLVDARILDLASPSARLIDVGKAPGHHQLPQGEINDLLVDLARRGGQVVRLKGGDPFVFGRGGEEALALARAGVPFEVVPGVSAALAAPAYAGIPVTHRGRASAVTIVTGHGCQEAAAPDWTALARADTTLVVLMGLSNLAAIAERLRAAGLPPTTPVAVVEQGTRPDQRTVEGTLENIATRVAAAGVASPATIVIGEVVSLREHLAWFPEQQPSMEVLVS
jgi:uroporphyrin-III C-methyltransferase/precorrin-2 dehydrogenase/sirohydrochlorin ferrochelatase